MKLPTLLTTLTLATLGSSTALKPPRSTPEFTWTSWVNSLIADPAHALSPSEALAAFHAANPNPSPDLSTSETSTDDANLDKRQAFANCQQLSSRPPSVPDAVACINDLAGRGNAGQECNVDGFTARVQCRIGSADVVSVRGRDDAPRSVNCNDIARAAGVIMDRCTRGDNTVSGAAYIPQGGVAVQIQGR